MLRNVKAIGMSARPDMMSDRRLRRTSFAVNIRWTMSWSVPCVPIVIKTEPIRPAKIVYSVSNIPFHLSQPLFAGSRPVAMRSETWNSPARADSTATRSGTART